MATYKVIQDIEAEDKFIGPLTLKQFVFAAIGVVFSYLCFFVVVRGAWFIAIPFAPVALFGFFMAIPWSKDQPTDLWVLAKIRFRIKPKKRIWSQAGMQELVTITAPKKVEKILTKDLSETEVKSRLKALADTMNTRGWAVKHIGLQSGLDNNSDRLLPVPSGPQNDFMQETPDMLENSKVDVLINESEKTRKANLQTKINQVRQGLKVDQDIQTPSIEPVDDSTALGEQLKTRKRAATLATGNMQTLRSETVTKKPSKDAGSTLAQKAHRTEEKKTISTVTESSHPDIISLAHNNDLDVATLARQAGKDNDDTQEVVISLH